MYKQRRHCTFYMSNKQEGKKWSVVKKKVFEKVGVMAPSLETGSSQLTSQYAQLSFRKTSISFFVTTTIISGDFIKWKTLITVGLFLERKLNGLLRKISYESAEMLNISRIHFPVLIIFVLCAPGILAF